MIPLFKVFMSPEARRGTERVLSSGFVGQGPEVEAFEREFSLVAPVPIVSTNSCTSAIHMVLTHLGVGPGDEVVTTPLTCVATNSPILAVGARPVWADVDPVTGNIDPRSVEQRITKRTKAIIAVDWTGRPADYQALHGFGPPVIQDAAHGPLLTQGATLRGDYVCYSFGPIKHLCAVDGGAVGTWNPSDLEELRLLRWYGLDRRSREDFRCAQDITLAGQKWHMNDLNAAIVRANLMHLGSIVGAHRDNAARLWSMIDNKKVVKPPLSTLSNYWVFPLLVRDGFRNEFKEWMESCGVMCSQVHARNDRHTAYRYPSGPLPGVDEFDASQVNIPCGWWLREEDLVTIAMLVNVW